MRIGPRDLSLRGRLLVAFIGMLLPAVIVGILASAAMTRLMNELTGMEADLSLELRAADELLGSVKDAKEQVAQHLAKPDPGHAARLEQSLARMKHTISTFMTAATCRRPRVGFCRA